MSEERRRTPDAPSTTPRTPRPAAAARHAAGSPDRVEQFASPFTHQFTEQFTGQVPGALKVAGVPLLTAALLATNAPANAAVTAQPAHRPAGGGSTAAASLVGVSAHTQVQATYTVKPGDTLTDISARTKISIQALVAANDLPPTGLIRIGQLLVLPGLQVAAPAQPAQKPAPAPAAKPAVPANPAGPAKPAAPQTLTHVVREGDTVIGLADRYQIAPASIVAANRLRSPHLIQLGRTLTLPGVQPPAAPKPPAEAAPAEPATAAKPAAAQPAEPPSTREYVVKSGDSLIAISESEKVALTAILDLNSLTTDRVIHPGQKLLLPAPPKPKVPNTFLGRTYPAAVAQAAAANRATLAGRKVPDREQMKDLVIDTSLSMGVDPALALAVAYQESGFNARVVSPANAIGTMQVLPGTGRWASDLVGRKLDLLVPQDNVTAGVAVLAALMARADEDEAIAGYYQGLASVQARGMFEDTKSYVASVKAHRKRFVEEHAKAQG